jgi:hypothetical protein
MSIISTILGLLANVSLVACDSEITNLITYPSPDGKFFLAVVTGLQAANDPAPFWTHVSLGMPGDETNKIPGNVLKLQGRTQKTTCEWHSPSTVVLNLWGDFKDLNKVPREKTTKGVTIMLVVHQRQRRE